MGGINITRDADKDEMKRMGVFGWPIWEKKPGGGIERSGETEMRGNCLACWSSKGCRLVLPTVLVTLVAACGPMGGEDSAPAFLELDRQVITIGPADDTKFLELTNTGGQNRTWQIEVAAAAAGFDWLNVLPMTGVLAGGASATIAVQPLNRDSLPPDTYQGQIKVIPEGLEARSVDVTLTVGQPILAVEPTDVLDFGTEDSSLNLLVKNAGAGKLIYTIDLPGEWLQTDAILQNGIRANEPQNIVFTVDREQVPWYGQKSGDLVLTSNGLEDAHNSSTAMIEVRVVVDDSCEPDTGCAKEGYYCDANKESCVERLDDGHDCVDSSQCLSGFCVEDVCCDKGCENQCHSCLLEGNLGTCTPFADGTECDDGLFCTEGDECTGGECVPGEERDCSEQDSDCSGVVTPGVCDDDLDGCVPGDLGDQCVIEGVCYEKGDWHPEVECLQCDPERSATAWSILETGCYVEGQCYGMGDSMGDCFICNPVSPSEPSPAPDDTPCEDDGDPCSTDLCLEGQCDHVKMSTGPCDDGNQCTKNDQCVGGECSGQLYSCDDGLDCTDDLCLGDGGCESTIQDGTCLVEGVCYGGNETAPGSFGCLQCKPAVDQEAWTPALDGKTCDDDDECTSVDKCQQGDCVGEATDCTDLLDCTEDSCDPDTGNCLNKRKADWCIIDSACYAADETPDGPDGDCSICDPYNSPEAWYHYLEGLACDDAKACTDATCVAGLCTEVGITCEDNNECTTDGCDDVGECEYLAVDNGTECTDDGLDCTNDVCQEGECDHPTLAGQCLIGESCQSASDSKEGSAGCLVCSPGDDSHAWTAAAPDTDCDDGLFCTVEDKCESGECNGQPRECETDQCNEAYCIEDQSKCVKLPLPGGTECDDGDPCTLADECTAGECGGETKDCSAATGGDPCLKGVCLPDSEPDPGTCVAQAVEDDESCEDGLFCTENDSCTAGQCGGDAVVCDLVPCNLTECTEEAQGCTSVADPDQVGDFCEDGKICSSDTICQANGACSGGWLTSPQDCWDQLAGGNQCMAGECLEPGGCQLSGLMNGTPCELQNATAECQKTVCEFVECQQGFDNCNEDDTDGCESEVLEDPDNCGQCGQKCSLEHAIADCSNGQCEIEECLDGYSHCDEILDNGCETVTSDNMEHCGGCDQPCKEGDRFANAFVACQDSQCVFKGCTVAYQDFDQDCANGDDCANGCELCKPLVDGKIEIPDDGVDNDCFSGDTVNDEARGYYVDPQFEFGGGCTDPGQGTRACPFKELIYAVFEVQISQDWSVGVPDRREIYVAGGDIFDNKAIVEIDKAIMLLGGYIRTGSGPWERNLETSETRLRNMDGEVVKGGSANDDYAVLDGLTLSARVLVSGNLVLRRIQSSPLMPLGVRSTDGEAGRAWVLESHIQGDVGAPTNSAAAYWVVRESTVTDFVWATSGPGWTIYTSKVANIQSHNKSGAGAPSWLVFFSTITGFIKGCRASGWKVKYNAIGEVNPNCEPPVSGGGSWAVYGNSVKGEAVIGLNADVSENRFEGGLSINASAEMWRNTVIGDLQLAGGWFADNLVVGRIAGTQYTAKVVLVNNTVYVPPDGGGAAITASSDMRLLHNVIVWDGETDETYYGLKELEEYSEATQLGRNAFVGFDGPNGVLFGDSEGGEYDNILQVNMLSELPDCGKGGNLAYSTMEEAAFLGTAPDSSDFLRPSEESPLVNAGIDLPHTCGGTEFFRWDYDLSGNATPCEGTHDLGCYEYCD